MSLAEYQSTLPDIFNGSASRSVAKPSLAPVKDPSAGDTGAKENKKPSSTQGTKDKEIIVAGIQPDHLRKGFIDIIELHKKNSDGGYDQQIFPTSRYLPKKAKRATRAQKYGDHVLVLRRTVMQQRDVVAVLRVELEIQSRELCKALRRIMRNCYENTNLQTHPIRLAAPFMELFFYRSDIGDLTERGDASPELRRDAQLLHNFILSNGLLSSILHDHERYNKSGQVAGDILWTIYPPNSLALVNVGGVQECWLVRNVLQVRSPEGNYLWNVTGLRVGCNGKKPGFFRQSCFVAAVTLGLNNIAKLPLVPVDHVQGWKEVKSVLAERRLRLQQALGESLMSFKPQVYKGDAWKWFRASAAYTPSETPLLEEKQVDERVIVDYQAFRDRNPTSYAQVGEPEDLRAQSKYRTGQPVVRARGVVVTTEPDSSRNSDDSDDSDGSDDSDNSSDSGSFDDSDGDTNDTNQAFDGGRRHKNAGTEIHETMEFQSIGAVMDEADDTRKRTTADVTTLDGLAQDAEQVFHISREDFNLLFPAFVPAFGLKSKEWRWVMVDGLRNVEWNVRAFHSLQYDQGTKDLVHALVRGHKRGLKTGFDDLIAGKGQGLVFLLHGEPGLGKTLTAESIADYLERPLYSISGGEVGTDVQSAENRLNEIFDLTKRWDAVSLLDEADVLLCKRSSVEMERNAIVGVFLRKLEYLQGVLFLTTNRKNDFDEAFKSRIHVTISYSALSNNAQSAIWKRLIENNKDVKLDETWNDQVYTALGMLNLNGRTIKNILRTAVAYSYADGGTLALHHVVAMLRTELREVDENVDTQKVTPAERERRAGVSEGLAKLEQLDRENAGIGGRSPRM